MALTQYNYSLAADFTNHKAQVATLLNEIQATGITIAVDVIHMHGDSVEIWFKTSISSAEETILDAIVAAHLGESDDVDAPTMEDGRPLVRADTRPLNTSTYFSGSGDDSTSIGGGVSLLWDFSNDDNDYTGDDIPSGFKAKELLLTFRCPVYLKDGSIYFFNAPWGQYMRMDVVVPNGSFYPNPAGPYPAAALGLSGTEMYAQASGNVIYQNYVMNHRTYGDCPMGDELNAEGAAVEALPIGWYLRGLIVTPNSDNVSKGYASMEMYRCHTAILPGQNINDFHS